MSEVLDDLRVEMARKGNAIREARESIGWNEQRLADNACVNLHAIIRIERGERQDPILYDRLIQILKDRGVTFRDGEVFGPMHTSILEAIKIDELDIIRLRTFAAAGHVGMQIGMDDRDGIADIVSIQHGQLIAHRFIEVGSVSQTVVFPSGTEHRAMAFQLARITPRGVAWLELHNHYVRAPANV